MNNENGLVIMEKKNEGPDQADYGSLKEAAGYVIKKGGWTGLNPHKVLRLCMAYEKLSAAGAMSANELRMQIQAQSEFSETPVIDGLQAKAPAPGADELSEGARARVITSLTWLIADARYRFDECKNNLEDGSSGGYSPELTEAIGLLEGLKKGERHHDADTLKAAYRQGFEEAKKIILEEIQKLVKRDKN